MSNNKIALSFDIEDWYHTPLITGSPFAKFPTTADFYKAWTGEYDFITRPTLRILDLLERHKIRATFFMLGETLEKYPEIVKALQNTDHEIGCHGYNHHIAIDPTTKEQIVGTELWKEEVSSAKKLLENTFSRDVKGYRAPGAYFGNWMVSELRDMGFNYDSSIAYNSFYNKTNVKLKDIPSHPYWISSTDLSVNQEDKTIVELPWSNFKFGGLIFPVGGAFFFRLLGLSYFGHALRKNLKTGDTMFYIHPYDLSRKKMPMSNFKHRPFFWINQGIKAERRLEKLMDKFQDQFTTCEAVCNKFLNDGA
ncbi:MAG: polysaccharide deacetylase family protein [Flavobacteriales bacterium]|nr:polysaccharide deacetylase family protein [Flavobacteriales bacterium]